MSALFGQQVAQQDSNDNSKHDHHHMSSSTHPRPPPINQRRSRPNLRRQVVVAPEGLGPTPIELASVLPSPPPKRPTQLPARYEQYRHMALGRPTSGAPPLPNRPNRYSWAQMQQWQAAAMAAAAARSANTATDQSSAGTRSRLPFSSAASRVLIVNPMQIVNLSEHTKSSLIKVIEAVKRFSEKWFSHVLLLMFLAVYACFGAYIFISFEAPTEQWEKQQIIELRSRLVNDSWSEATSSKPNKEEFFERYEKKLQEYERLLNRACQAGMTSSSLENQWNFWGALFYSMTVFTTIGYGQLTPITFAGRVATMVYAIFGIPILLMVLADLGKLLTRIIKYTFKKFRYLYNKLMKRKESLRTRKLISDSTNQYIGIARGAFERGYATYIQPSYNRIPQALRSGTLKRKRCHDSDKPAAQSELEGVSEESEPATKTSDEKPTKQANETGATTAAAAGSGAKKPSAESSEVIVTPAKQTKPVSPVEQTGRQHASGPHLHHHHQSGHHQHHHSHSHHHHNHSANNAPSLSRAHSPALAGTGQKSTRKTSSSNNTPSKQRTQTIKGSLSRSSSRVSMTAGLVDKSKLLAQVKNLNELQVESRDVSQQVSDQSEAVTPVAANDKLPEANYDFTEPLYEQSANPQVETQSNGEPDVEDTLQVDGDSAMEEDLENDFDIPVSFALFLLVTYMMMGAVVFSIWEGWNFFDSLYFVFISMSTIGFGDLVPQHPKRMIGTFAYLLFGLALTSMCINVVQEKIHATFLKAKMQIGEKMGFDLDQIMADDYFDGSLGEVDQDGYGEDDCCSQANSYGPGGGGATAGCFNHAQTSASMSGHYQQQQSEYDQNPSDNNTSQLEELAAGLRHSKSRESLRSNRRRPLAGLAGHGGTTGGGSIRRRPSKRLSRQTTPPHLSHLESAPKSPLPKGVVEKAQTPSTPVVEPPTPVVSDLAPGSGKLPKLALQLAQRPLLITSQSQSDHSGVSKSFSSELLKTFSLEVSADNKSACSTPPRRQELIDRLVVDPKGGRRSEGSSRRSSVSHELNELDDLILSLSHSPSERFGPLLGIPSCNRSSTRPSSPSNLSPLHRRATSMMGRPMGTPQTATSLRPSPSPSSHSHSPSLSVGILQKKLSLGAQIESADKKTDTQMALEELEAIKFSAV